MATKLTNWTARTAVKIMSFLLILALVFIIMHSMLSFGIESAKTGVSANVIFADISTNQYFYELNMGTAYYNASRYLYYRSEESILAGEHIEWYEDAVTVELRAPGLNISYLNTDKITGKNPGWRAAEERNVIEWQLSEFRACEEYLISTEGFLYYMSTGSGQNEAEENQEPDRAFENYVFSNVAVAEEEQAKDFFRLQPVYIIADAGSQPVASIVSDSGSIRIMSFYDMGSYDDNTVVYVAFSSDAVDAKNSVYSHTQYVYRHNITLIAVSTLLIIILVVVLLLGAGRTHDGDGSRVKLLWIDKPFLDISLAFVAGWTALAVYLFYLLFNAMWYNNNTTSMNSAFAAFSVISVSPFLLWLISFAKRVKSGRFWRHTLIYFIPSRFVRFLKSLWVGFPLTAKVFLIAFASFCIMLFVGMMGAASASISVAPLLIALPVCTVVVAYFLLRYARRLQALVSGAQRASSGNYDTEISAGGGELGSIASSIASISAGINNAVESRMKSERLKTELITNVSHDIRTPLTSVITYADLLKHEGLDNAKAPEYLDILIQKSQRLKVLTDELFEAAKAATGNIDVKIEDLDIVSLINQVLGELDGSIKASGLEMRVNLPDRLLVRADGKLMWRVMENLLSNVFKYSLPSSRVYLSAGSYDDARAYIDLKNISATELNIDPVDLTERFKRGDASRADGGSGLGLSIVQSFMAAQGGNLEIAIDGDLFKASVHLHTKSQI